MSRLRIGPRLALSFSIIIVLMFVASAVGLWQFRQLQQATAELDAANQQARAAVRVHNDVLTLRDTLGSAAESRDATRFTQQAQRLQTQVSLDIAEAITALENSPATDNPLTNPINALRSTDRVLSAQIEAMVGLAEDNSWTELDSRLDIEVRDLVIRTAEVANSVRIVSEAQLTTVRSQIARAEQLVFTTTILAAVFTVAVATLLAITVTQSIARPLAQLNQGAQAWANGNFKHQVHLTGQDELAHLAAVFNTGATQLGLRDQQAEALITKRTAERHRLALQLETSIAVAKHIALTLNTDQLLEQVADIICQRYGYYYVGIFLLDETGQHIRTSASAGRDLTAASPPELTLRVGQEGIIGWVAQHQTAALVPDVSRDMRYTLWKTRPHTRSELALPLKVGDELLGVLDMQSDNLDAFSADELPVFQALADQLAIALRNATLYRSEQTQRALAETLQQVGKSLTSILNVNEVLNSILDYLASIVAHDRAAVMLRHGTELEFVAARGYGTAEGPRPNTRVPIQSDEEDNVFVKIYSTQAPLAIPNVNEYPAWKRVEAIRNPSSWLGLPLIRENEVIGILSMARLDVRPYTEAEITVATTFAAQAAVALENARLYERSKRFSQQMEYEVQNRTHALQEAYTQLEQLDRTKSSFISIASHELRTPITVLKGYSQILMNDAAVQANEYHKNLVSGIYTGAVRLHTIVDSMLDMAKIDGRTLQIYPEPLHLFDLINRVFSDLRADIQQRQLSLTITPGVQALPPLEADEDGLKKILYHLLVNAIKYTPDGGRITLDGRAWAETPPEMDWPAPGVELTIQDTGIGIDPANQDLIFMKFYQTGEVALHSTGRTKFKGGGPGLGLAITQGIVLAHRGRLWVESEGHDEQKLPGSTFHVVLPLRHGK